MTAVGHPDGGPAAADAPLQTQAAVPTPVVLVGFMGCGKSHVGKLLARLLGLPFVDSDRLIEAELGSIEAIFAERGERAFREAERRVVLGALGGLRETPAVVSLGGGAVSDGDVCAALRAAPYVAWLSAPVDVLWSRVRRAARRDAARHSAGGHASNDAVASGRGSGARPLAGDEATFRALYEQRLPLYREVATAEFRNDGDHSAAEVAEWVVAAVQGAA